MNEENFEIFLAPDARPENNETMGVTQAISEGTTGAAAGDGRPHAGDTLAASAYTRLRRDILRCRLTPGAKLRLETLRRDYSVGFSPLREALARLTGEGLTVVEGQRGFRVAPVSAGDLEDIAHLRSEIETMALRMSIENGSDAWEADVAAALHHLLLLPHGRWPAGSPLTDEWSKRHKHFHDSLVAACGSPRLLAIREDLFEHSERYRRLLIEYGTAGRDLAAEHREIASAVLARDVPAACALITGHIRKTATTMMAIISP
jgi:GntR family carbon starvation induced transcriptional regulator